jgi:flagellar protein FliO/FliZ
METSAYLQFALALMLVIGLILGLAYLLRRFGLGDGGTRSLGRKKRISTVESSMVDARHKLILVRRDGTEHFLLVGPGDSFVVERGITTENATENSTGNTF